MKKIKIDTQNILCPITEVEEEEKAIEPKKIMTPK